MKQQQREGVIQPNDDSIICNCDISMEKSSTFSSQQQPHVPPNSAMYEGLGSSLSLGAALLLEPGLLDHYGLDGPLPPPSSNNLNQASVTSVNTKRKKRLEEQKQATIRQHYYPEGGWGFVVVVVATLAQTISHGLLMSFGILALPLLATFTNHEDPQQRWIETGKVIIIQWTPLIVATSGPALSGHNNRWLLYPAVF